MAYEIGPIIDLPFTVKDGSDLSGKQYRIVEQTAAGECDLCNSAGDKPLGILQNKPTSGQTAIVRMLGVSKLAVNAAGLAADADWGTDAVGRGIAKVADHDIVGGRVLEAAGATVDLLATVTVDTLSPHRLSV